MESLKVNTFLFTRELRPPVAYRITPALFSRKSSSPTGIFSIPSGKERLSVETLGIPVLAAARCACSTTILRLARGLSRGCTARWISR